MEPPQTPRSNESARKRLWARHATRDSTEMVDDALPRIVNTGSCRRRSAESTGPRPGSTSVGNSRRQSAESTGTRPHQVTPPEDTPSKPRAFRRARTLGTVGAAEVTSPRSSRGFSRLSTMGAGQTPKPPDQPRPSFARHLRTATDPPEPGSPSSLDQQAGRKKWCSAPVPAPVKSKEELDAEFDGVYAGMVDDIMASMSLQEGCDMLSQGRKTSKEAARREGTTLLFADAAYA